MARAGRSAVSAMDSAFDEPFDLDILRSLADAIDARDRASLAILETLRALKATSWFDRWCKQHGIAPRQIATTTKIAKVIRAVLEKQGGTERLFEPRSQR